MDTQLGYDKYNVTEKQTTNSRNGCSKKTIKSELGSVEHRILFYYIRLCCILFSLN